MQPMVLQLRKQDHLNHSKFLSDEAGHCCKGLMGYGAVQHIPPAVLFSLMLEQL